MNGKKIRELLDNFPKNLYKIYTVLVSIIVGIILIIVIGFVFFSSIIWILNAVSKMVM